MNAETEVLWSELHTRLLSFLRRRVATPEDAEDLLQDVFTRIHENAPTLREVESVTGWVYRTAANAVTDYYRRRGAFARATEALAAEPAAVLELEDSAGQAELAHCLRPLIATLPDTYGRALELTELEGRTQSQAAESLGISISGMKSRVQRGRTKLKEVLLECCHVELDRRGGVVEYEPRDGARCRCGAAVIAWKCSRGLSALTALRTSATLPGAPAPGRSGPPSGCRPRRRRRCPSRRW